MATVIIDRGNNEKMQNTPNIDGLIYFNSDDNCIYLDNGSTRTIYGGKIPTITSVSNNDGASNSNIYTALAAKNGFCIKANVADSADNINNTSENGRPVGCIGFKSVIGTTDISHVGSNVKDSIANIGNRLVVDNNKFVFDYQDGKWGFNTSEERGADTFHPFNSTSLCLTQSTTDYQGTILTNKNKDIVANYINLQFKSLTDSATTKLPIDFTTGTGVVTYHDSTLNGKSSSTYVNGGIIHVFDDTNHGSSSSGTHNHYMLLEKWYTGTSKTPIATEYTNTPETPIVGLPFVIPSIYKYTTNGIDYLRNDELRYYVCYNSIYNQGTAEEYRTCGFDIYWYSYDSSNYNDGNWGLVGGDEFVLMDNTMTNYQIGSDKTMVWYKGNLHIFGGTYQKNGQSEIFKDTNHYIINNGTIVDTIPITHNFINCTIYATLIHNDKIYIFYYDDNATTRQQLRYVTYYNDDFREEGYIYNWGASFSLIDKIDTQSKWIEYNGEIHVLGGNGNNKMHISLTDTKFNTDSAEPYSTYNNLQYPLKDGVVCVAQPVVTNPQNTYAYTYEDATRLNIPTLLHYMGTSQANPSSGNYRKLHYQIQNTYLSSIYNSYDNNFIMW